MREILLSFDDANYRARKKIIRVGSGRGKTPWLYSYIILLKIIEAGPSQARRFSTFFDKMLSTNETI